MQNRTQHIASQSNLTNQVPTQPIRINETNKPRSDHGRPVQTSYRRSGDTPAAGDHYTMRCHPHRKTKMTRGRTVCETIFVLTTADAVGVARYLVPTVGLLQAQYGFSMSVTIHEMLK